MINATVSMAPVMNGIILINKRWGKIGRKAASYKLIAASFALNVSRKRS